MAETNSSGSYPRVELDKQSGFQDKLQKILTKPLSPENIDIYAEDALSQLIDLVQTIVDDYKYQPTLEFFTDSEREEAAFSYYRTGEIERILDHIQEKSEEILHLDRVIECASETSTIITPPLKNDMNIIPNTGEFAEKQTIPRLKTVLFIVKNSLEIDIEDNEQLKLTRGALGVKMMRNSPYYLVEIPKIGRTVLVCDEEGNATFVLNDQAMAEVGIQSQDIMPLTKQDLEELINEYPEMGRKLIYHPSTFVRRVSELLGQNFNAKEDVLNIETEDTYLYPIAPEGYLTKDSLWNELGISESTLRRAVETLGIEPQPYRGKTKHIRLFYSPDQMAQVRDYLESRGVFLDLPPDGFQNIQSLISTLGLAQTTVRGAITGTDVSGSEYKEIGKKATLYYSPEEVEIIRMYLDEKKLLIPEAPEGYMGISEMMRFFGLKNSSTVRRAVDYLGLEGKEYRVQNGAIIHYSPDSIEAVRLQLESEGLFAGVPPASHGAIPEIAEQLQVSRDTIAKSIKKLEIKGDVYKGKSGRPELHYRLDDVQKLKVFLIESGRSNLSFAPEGYMHKDAIWQSLGTSEALVKQAINELSVAGEGYRTETQNRSIAHYAPRDVHAISEWLTARQEGFDVIPEGEWKTAQTLASEYSVDITTIHRAGENSGISGTVYARCRGGTPLTYYSVKDEEILAMFMEQRGYLSEFSPEGFRTITNLEEEWGIGSRLLIMAIESLKIEPALYRSSRSKRPQKFYSPEQMQQIRVKIEELVQGDTSTVR